MEMFLGFNKKALPYQADRVIAAATYLKDKAFNWFKPKLKDFLESGKDISKDTMQIFKDYQEYIQELENTYSNINKVRVAEQ